MILAFFEIFFKICLVVEPSNLYCFHFINKFLFLSIENLGNCGQTKGLNDKIETNNVLTQSIYVISQMFNRS